MGKIIPVGLFKASGNVADGGKVSYVGQPTLNMPIYTNQQNVSYVVPIPIVLTNNITLALAANGTINLAAAAAAQKWWVWKIIIAVSVAGKARLEDNGGALIDLVLPANISTVIDLPQQGLMALAANTTLLFRNTQAVPVDVTITAIGQLLST